MLKTIIIEDERPARESLLRSIAAVSEEINVLAMLASVKESIEWFGKNPNADIIFSDVQLPDGLSFEIFSRSGVNIPVIFVTGYDQFMMNAFEYNGIDYLLKPVDERELEKALSKYKMLQHHFTSKALEFSKMMIAPEHRKKTRLIVRKGLENITLPIENIVLLYTENKIVYAFDDSGKKYFVDKNLSELELELDDSVFFRANRQYIINVKYIKCFKAYEKVKLKVDISPADLNDRHQIIISQETAPAFRKWIYEA